MSCRCYISANFHTYFPQKKTPCSNALEVISQMTSQSILEPPTPDLCPRARHRLNERRRRGAGRADRAARSSSLSVWKPKHAGANPGHITAVRPMKDGVIADFTYTEKMLHTSSKKCMETDFWSPSPGSGLRALRIHPGGTARHQESAEGAARAASISFPSPWRRGRAGLPSGGGWFDGSRHRRRHSEWRSSP